MRSLLLLAAVCCLVLSACGSPIARSEEDKQVARQAPAAAAPAPAASTDDDDDEDEDDDDDDVDLPDGLDDDDDEDDDDDDDDDEEEESDDDEDDDYLERFFDDILGGDEDDDDEETNAGVQPVVAPVDTIAAAPAAAAASAEEVAAASEENEVQEAEAVAEGEEPEAGQKEPASAEVEAPAASAEVAAEADEDDEEEDITDALDPEEDDEDEDEEEDDEDDDITDALGRNISVKHSRSLGDEPEKKPAPVPAVYIVKYNRFVDTVLEKMNEILRKSYDPVNVKLQPIDASKKSSKPKKTKSKTKNRKTSSKKKNTARGNTTKKDKDKVLSTAIPEMAKDENIQLNEIRPNDPALEQIVESTTSVEFRALKSNTENGKAKPTTTKVRPPTKATKPKPKPKPPTKTTIKKPVTTKNKVKTSEKNKPRAKGTLYGLSTLRRSGDVAVSIKTDQTTIKSNFAVGPLILRVEKEVGRGAKKELKSATATTTEMVGKISLRVNNEGVATLHSIKVLQPKQVRVDSDHERTRELVWQRSARIAHVVSEKLMSASKPMFHRQTVVKQ